jgi:hypothetical protein
MFVQKPAVERGGDGRVTQHPLLHHHNSSLIRVDIRFKDDVTFILPLGVSFMVLPNTRNTVLYTPPESSRNYQ